MREEATRKKRIDCEGRETAWCRLAVLTHQGDRTEQQDSWGWAFKDAETLAVVCDGMGGLEKGIYASSLTRDYLLETFRDKEGPAALPDLIRALQQADRKLSEETDRRENPAGVGTTALAVLLIERKLFWCGAGDSRGYLFRRGELIQFTQDHNLLAALKEQLQSGLISREAFERQAAGGEALISYVGLGKLSLLDYSKKPFCMEPQDRMLLTTDGLYRLVEGDILRSILTEEKDIEKVLWKLEAEADQAARRGRIPRDNMTTIVIEIK